MALLASNSAVPICVSPRFLKAGAEDAGASLSFFYYLILSWINDCKEAWSYVLHIATCICSRTVKCQLRESSTKSLVFCLVEKK